MLKLTSLPTAVIKRRLKGKQLACCYFSYVHIDTVEESLTMRNMVEDTECSGIHLIICQLSRHKL